MTSSSRNLIQVILESHFLKVRPCLSISWKDSGIAPNPPALHSLRKGVPRGNTLFEGGIVQGVRRIRHEGVRSKLNLMFEDLSSLFHKSLSNRRPVHPRTVNKLFHNLIGVTKAYWRCRGSGVGVHFERGVSQNFSKNWRETNFSNRMLIYDK